MRVAILNITAGGLSGGYKKYLNHILPRLTTHPKISALLVGIPETINCSAWERDYPVISWIKFKINRFSKFGVNCDIKKVIKFQPDVVFIPTARSPKIRDVPVVTMVQNMEPLSYSGGNPLSERIVNWFRAKETHKSILSANRIIAISYFVKEFLIRELRVEPQKLGLIYHGVDSQIEKSFQKPSIIPSGWKNSFLFTAGSIRPARGLEDIINSMRELAKSSDLSGLIIAGSAHHRMHSYNKHLRSWIEKKGLTSKIIWAGNLNNEEMKWCYQNCYAFIMTSKVEACPNTALEALSNGCLCVSSDCDPMPEIFKDAAIYYSAGDEKALTCEIQDILSWDAARRKRASENAKASSIKYSWDVCADLTVSEMVKAIKN